MDRSYCPLAGGACRKDCMFRLSNSDAIELDKKCQLFKVVESVEYLIDHDTLTDYCQHTDQ